MPLKVTLKTPTPLEQEILDLIEEMKTVTKDSPEYAKMAEQLREYAKTKDPNSKDKATLKDWIPVIGSIGAVALIIFYESMGHTIASKAVGFIRKP